MNNKKKIFIFTFTRAEYGLLRWTIKALKSKGIGVLVASGAHLSRFYGMTIKEIESDKIGIDYQVDFLLDSDSPSSLTKSIGVALISISQIFMESRPDIVIILGDRYELFSSAIAAMMFKIPIIHIAGGERTKGIIDEQVRHSITKLSHIHIVSTEVYAENVSKMGEEDWRIHILGSPGIENIYKLPLLGKKELAAKLDLREDLPIMLVTYHPVTLENKLSTKDQIENLINALRQFKDYQIIFTSPGVESESSIIVEEIQKFVSENPKARFFKSLGSLLYLSVMKNASVVVGNSSSGIIEAPSLKVPTVNIGSRQEGRVAAKSVINCGYEIRDIVKAIEKALYDKNFKNIVRNIKNPYDPFGDGDFSGRLIKIVENMDIDGKLMKKELNFNVDRTEWNYLLKGGSL